MACIVCTDLYLAERIPTDKWREPERYQAISGGCRAWRKEGSETQTLQKYLGN